MGERMKSAESLEEYIMWVLINLQSVSARGSMATISYDTTLRSLSGFKQGLKDLGAI